MTPPAGRAGPGARTGRTGSGGRAGSAGGAGRETGAAPIDALRPGDAGGCAYLEAVLFPGDDPWSAATFASELRAGHHYLAARRGGALVGYAGIALLPAPTASPGGAEAEVHTIGVDPAEQGRGTGRALLRGLLTAADGLGAETFLEVRTDNAPALALYASEGFEVVGTRRRYYASGADAHTMRRPPVGDPR